MGVISKLLVAGVALAAPTAAQNCDEFVRFTDVSASALGPDRFNRAEGPFGGEGQPVSQGEPFRGVAVFDYDNDGDDDILYLAPHGSAHGHFLYRNDGYMKFTDVSAEAGFGPGGRGQGGVVAADFDNDGHIDLVMSGSGGIFLDLWTPSNPGPAAYRNNGDGTFTDVTADAFRTTRFGFPLATPTQNLMVSAADYNNDGLLDVMFIDSGSLGSHAFYPSRLVRNAGPNGASSFSFMETDGFIFAPPTLPRATVAVCATGFNDYNEDGNIDLFQGVCNDPYLAVTALGLQQHRERQLHRRQCGRRTRRIWPAGIPHVVLAR